MVFRTVALTCALALVAADGGSTAANLEPGGLPAAAVPTPTFAVSGRGWGHGVGMSQWGAYGFAQRGLRYRPILAHYYRGTLLGRAPVSRVRVLLAENQERLSIGSPAPFRVRDALGILHRLDAGTYPLGPGLRLKPVGKAKPLPLPPPLLFSAGRKPLELNAKAYRGSIQVGMELKRLHAINNVGLEPYLYGVVPDEMPHTWLPEALKAQAVVARSYALSVRKPTGPYDLYADVRSQVYNGIAAEEAPATSAVDATAGQVLLFGGRIATTFFFSTSGGRTAAISDVWSARPTPYLVSVPDPYDGISPHHSWGPFAFTAQTLGKALGVQGSLLDVRTRINPSGRVAEVIGVASTGESALPATEFRRKLDLRSTWFRIGVLALVRPPKPVAFGGPTELAGVARDLRDVLLESRPAGGVWRSLLVVTPAADGTFVARVNPIGTTEYRLASGTVRSAPIRIDVAPVVRLQRAADGSSLQGTIRPPVAGTTVVVERREGALWSPVARALVDERGIFTGFLDLLPGSYRARTIAGGGFAGGVSAVLAVTGR